jgi:hypothetical protein
MNRRPGLLAQHLQNSSPLEERSRSHDPERHTDLPCPPTEGDPGQLPPVETGAPILDSDGLTAWLKTSLVPANEAADEGNQR